MIYYLLTIPIKLAMSLFFFIITPFFVYFHFLEKWTVIEILEDIKQIHQNIWKNIK